jgi:WD40 repeat protein
MDPAYEHFPSVPYDTDAICSSRVLVHSGGTFFVSQTSDELQVRYARGGKPRKNLEIEGIQSAAFSPDGRLLAVGTQGKSALLYDVESWEEVAETDGCDDYVDQIAWLGGGEYLAIGSARSELAIHRVVRKGAAVDDAVLVREILEADPEYNSLFGMTATPSGSHVFFASGEKLRCFEASSGREMWRREYQSSTGELSLSPDGRMLAMGSSDGRIVFLDATNGEPTHGYTFRFGGGIKHPGMIGDAVSWGVRPRFSADGAVVVTNTPNGAFVIVDARTGAALWEAPRSRGLAWIEDLAWFGDGQHLLTACTDGIIGLWQMRPPACVATFKAYDDEDPELA